MKERVGFGPLVLLLFCLSACAGSHSHEHGALAQKGAPVVVPEAEKATAQKKALDGPTQTSGIESVANLASIALGEEFEGLEGQQLRVRELVIEPGGIVAVHEHNKRPGVAYIIEGEMVEHRSDESEPIVHKAGSVAVERTGVSHWWENKSDKPARALVIDILPAP